MKKFYCGCKYKQSRRSDVRHLEIDRRTKPLHHPMTKPAPSRPCTAPLKERSSLVMRHSPFRNVFPTTTYCLFNLNSLRKRTQMFSFVYLKKPQNLIALATFDNKCPLQKWSRPRQQSWSHMLVAYKFTKRFGIFVSIRPCSRARI